jgi:signal peptidase I
MDILRRLSSFFLDVIETVVVALSIFLVIYLFFLQPHQVQGQSMEPNFHTGEYLLTDKVSYQTGDPQRGDVVVFHAPEAAGCVEGTGCDFIKRIIGIPGDTVAVKDNSYYVNGMLLPEPYLPSGNITRPADFAKEGREILLGPEEYFVSGDNRPHSHDSRAFGPITRQDIVGRAFFRYWPSDKIGIIPRITYEGISTSGVFSTN